MDAKILKAAVSAAIKVTITTTLVGCGGMVTSSGGGPGAASGGQAGTEPMTAATAPVGGAPVGGAPVGGTAATAETGSSGAPSGGSTDATCAGAEVDACYAFLAQAEAATFGQPLAAANQACCQTVLDSLVNGEPGSVCLSDNIKHFDQSPARTVCCRDPASWSVYPACAPWGPPVPPELSLEALLDWQAAA